MTDIVWNVIGYILILLTWTVFREVLLDKYWRYTTNRHLYEFGNLYVIIYCIVITGITLYMLNL